MYFQEYFGENVLHIAIIKGNAQMVEWLLNDKSNLPYRQQQLLAVASGNFFQVYVQREIRASETTRGDDV